MTELPPLPPGTDSAALYALAFGRDRQKQSRLRYGCVACRRKWFPSQTENGIAPEHTRGKQRCAGSGQSLVDVERTTLPIVPQEYDSAAFWDNSKSSAASLLRGVCRKYAKERGPIVWRRERRTPEFLYPYPFPVHQKSWVLSFGGQDNQQQPLVSIGLPGGRVTVRLRGGPEFTRQLRILRMIEGADVAQQEMKICRQRSHACFANAKDVERNAGSSRVSYRVMLRIACQIPVGPLSDSETIADVRTGSSPFFTLIIPGQEPFYLHSDEVRGWIIAHRAFLDHMADDLKYEKRWPKKKRKRMLGRIEVGCDKHDRRMTTFQQQCAHMLCAHAARRNCGGVRFDSSDRSFLDRDVPWYSLEENFENKCEELGLLFDSIASGNVVETETPDNNGVNNISS